MDLCSPTGSPHVEYARPTESDMSTSRVRQRPISHVYDAAYTGVPNWDIGRPQQAFVWLAESGLVRDPVLDVGCGTGELSLYLARQGHRVLGIDLSQVAIAVSRQKAAGRQIDATFLVWDALDMPRLATAGISFRTVVDSGMFHVLGDRERKRFVAGLASVVGPGGCYWVLGDAQTNERPGYGITPAEIEHRFCDGGQWAIIGAYETAFQRRWASSAAYFVGLERQPSALPDP